MLLPLQDILIRPVHKNFTQKNGHAEPILLVNGCYTNYGQMGWIPLLPYIRRQPYVATSRLLYSWVCGDSRSHTLGRIFNKDTRSLCDTVSAINAMWVHSMMIFLSMIWQTSSFDKTGGTFCYALNYITTCTTFTLTLHFLQGTSLTE